MQKRIEEGLRSRGGTRDGGRERERARIKEGGGRIVWLSNKLHSRFPCLKFSLDGVGMFEERKPKNRKHDGAKLERAPVCSARGRGRRTQRTDAVQANRVGRLDGTGRGGVGGSEAVDLPV